MHLSWWHHSVFIFVKTGDTPLHAALMRGQSEIVKLLVTHGADMNSCDKVSCC